jgi:hypothetical protein
VSGALRLTLAAAVLWLVLVQPNHPEALTWGALAVVPLEWPAILAAVVLAGTGWAGRMLRAALVAALVAVAVLKLADFGTFVAFQRGFNLVADLHLIPAAWNLGRGSLGLPLALAIVAGAVGAVAAVAAALWWALAVWARLAPRQGARVAAAVLILPALALAAAEVGHARRAWSLPPDLRAAIPGAAFTARVALERWEQVQTTRADLIAFRAAAAADPALGAGPFFDRAGGRDIVLIYVESYGRSSLDNPLHAATHAATLAGIEADLAARGLAMRSTFATAPMAGGQSWLAHGSVAAGLWLDGQSRYRAFLASGRRTLFHLAQAEGRRTVAIMPAHVFPWPEGAAFGFDAILNAADLGYAGPRFNWVTMPDQFTLLALERQALGAPGARPDRPPLLAQVALVSSHAPWVPIPPVIGWDEVGDGQVYDRWAHDGDPPDVVWRDHDRVRDQFRQAIDYSLQVVGAWAARHAADPPLMIVLGDHQPALFVAGVPGYDVPLHVIGPPDLVALFDGPDWTDGLIPAPEATPIRMDALRDRLLSALGSGAP